jgi:hypothetical protein
MHATKGVVKSMDATKLVISRSGRDMSFALNPSTQREGNVKVGSPWKCVTAPRRIRGWPRLWQPNVLWVCGPQLNG